jgi:FkbM family methyltransferase
MILRSLAALNRAPWWRTPVATWGGRFQPSSADRLAYLWLHKLGIMGRDRALLEAQVEPGMVVADIGANIGLYTYLLARCAGERGFVYAFEPDPDLFAALEANCRTNGVANVRLQNVALGAQDDTLTLRRARFNSGDNRLSRRESSPASGEVSVPVRPLDAVLEGRLLDFIKIDVQGWELEVFKGMRGQLAGSRPLRIYFEFWPAGLRPAGSDPAELLAFLRQHGLSVYRTENHTLTPLSHDDGLAGPLKSTGWINLMAIR